MKTISITDSEFHFIWCLMSNLCIRMKLLPFTMLFGLYICIDRNVNFVILALELGLFFIVLCMMYKCD